MQSVLTVAKYIYSNEDLSFEPTEAAQQLTLRAAQTFFTLAYQIIHQNGRQFPLAGRNKCLGMAVVPHTSLVLMAVSQDKIPETDVQLRRNMMILISAVNKLTKEWVFELVRVPTPEEYNTIPKLAPLEKIEPRPRCVEPALAVGLCKAGRFKKFNPEECAVIPFGGTLWAASTGNEAALHFEGAERNLKYVTAGPLKVELHDGKSGWIDVWNPCGIHCAKYRKAMLAIGAAGGPGSSFPNPRGEGEIYQPKIL